MATPTRILVVTSGGGHWAQMLRLRAAFDGIDTAFATVDAQLADDVPDQRFHLIRDANRWRPLLLVRSAAGVLRVVLKERPSIVVSTGAAPGLFGVIFGKLGGARTIWIDSIANAEELSMSGRLAGRWADLWLTQWPELAREGGPVFEGAVL